MANTHHNATQTTGAETSHVVYPACQCGHAYGAHTCGGWHPIRTNDAVDVCNCMQYRPSRGVDEFTSTYRPWTTTRGLRRLVCVTAWWVERQARTVRRRVERQA